MSNRLTIQDMQRFARLELDGYCRNLSLAFEYNGEQHYRLCRWFKMEQNDLDSIRSRDRLKVELCRSHGVRLIVIPYTIRELKKYIEECLENFQ